MNFQLKWPILHILVGIPIVLSISTLIGSVMDGWQMSKDAILYGATMTTPVAMAYTFLVTLVERSYYMVFWAREKIKEEMRQAREDARAQGEAHGVAQGVAQGVAERDREWRDWYERMQAAQREGRPFDEPPPKLPENGNHS